VAVAWLALLLGLPTSFNEWILLNMASAGQIKLFTAAQAVMLSAAPPTFTLSNPPSIGWWKAKFDLGLAAAAFIHHFQSILGTKMVGQSGAYWQSDFTARWQALSGITPKQWARVKTQLDGASGVQLVTTVIGKYAGAKGTWIRPSDSLLAIFGMTLSTYDVVAALDERTSWRLSKAKGPNAVLAAAQPVSEAEFDALQLWTMRGGLARLYNPKYLADLLETHNGHPTAQL
jgi:hypothetical protein